MHKKILAEIDLHLDILKNYDIHLYTKTEHKLKKLLVELNRKNSRR